MSDAILKLADISKAFFGVPAVRDVSLELGRGRILALIGQNGAGKSTLMNVIGGVVRPDSGQMAIDDAPYEPRGSADAGAHGVAFIHQELNLFTNLTVAENIFIDRFPTRTFGPVKLIDRTAMYKRARELLVQVDLDIGPDVPVERLSPGERQLVEIAKALHLDARIIIFDEPTTSLTSRETARLFALIERLRQTGTSMIYISHVLGDVMRLADYIAVLRDGELVASGPKDDFDVARMITMMVGRSIDQLYPARTATPRPHLLLAARDVTARGLARNISFTLRSGEILGLFGLMGSGRSELARILYGLDAFDSGDISIGDRLVTKPSAPASARNGIAFVTENRREEGLLMNMSIAENVALAALPRYSVTPLQFVEQARLMAATAETAEALRIKARSLAQPAKSLSGGNQQKVVFAKWLMTRPSIFIMDEPTRGIDVGAKYEIYAIIDRLAAEGSGILFISSEIEEVMAMCDRILVMSKGELVGAFDRLEFNPERILRAAFREEVVAA